MDKPLRVVVYGSSLTMAGIAASLKLDAELEVVYVNPRAFNVRQALVDLNPAAIAFDLSDPFTGVDLTLLRGRPGMLLVGVDPSSDELLVLSSQPVEVHCMADLVKVIRQNQPHSESSK